MAGPVVGLLLFEQRSFDDVVADVTPWLRAFCESVGYDSDGDLAFWLHGRLFVLAEDDVLPGADGEDYSALPAPPVQELVLSAGCASPEDHRLLGQLALDLAPRFGA
ncbi:hypothetical protein GCM10010218_30810 [Streptomyces mashuensis]|uniref:Uncharacterized protein n=1 Tax=Streptomyces mashuensis TaxID=33904 RepID=A0A919ED96_9ACTN|nr:hypothetical protein GCM10010218_30810 [Streptomyces mashuensis]